MEFTFAVLAYNQASIIVETLESIKYQITVYGDKTNFNLILTDDSSSDNTVRIVKKWADDNKNLFKNVKIIANQINLGTVKNYNTIMENINDEQFKVIAGDDVIGPNNIFEQISDGKKYIDTFPFICLKNGIVSYRKDYLYDYFYKYYFYKPTKNIKWVKLGDFLHTPSTFYSKKLYQMGNAAEYNKEFDLFEDDPTFYSIFKNVETAEVKFHKKPLILYRYTENSTSTIPNKRFLNDWRKLQKNYANDSHFLSALFYQLREKNRFEKKINFCRVFTKLKIIYRTIVINLFCKKEFINFLSLYKIEILNFKNHYDTIKNKSDYFMKEIKADASN